MHRNGPIGLYHRFVHLWKDNLAIGANKIIVAFVDVSADNIHVKERLLN